MPDVKTILLADDDRNDVFLVKAAFSRAGYDFPFIVVPNGEEAINYLKGLGKYSDRQRFPVPTLLPWTSKCPEWTVLRSSAGSAATPHGGDFR
jgi:hypothetical protein